MLHVDAQFICDLENGYNCKFNGDYYNFSTSDIKNLIKYHGVKSYICDIYDIHYRLCCYGPQIKN